MPTPSKRPVFCLLAFLALVYALLAGLRTVGEFDLGWQMATGRWVLQHHAVPSGDVLSYTAAGHRFIYPVFSGIIFFLLQKTGGWAAISWVSALGCVFTILAMLWRGSGWSAVLATIAVPAIVFRTAPRAELFSTLLFAVYLGLLWRYHRGNQGRLWLLPVLMLVWVNLHPGFVAGLALCLAFLGLESLAWLQPSHRETAWQHLQQLSRYGAATLLVTLLNPWGWKIYLSLWDQGAGIKAYGDFVGEWARVPFNLISMQQALDVRDPESSFWWLFGSGLIAAIAALAKRSWSAFAILLIAVPVSILRLRYHGVFAIVVVMIGGTVFHEVSTAWQQRWPKKTIWNTAAAISIVLVAGLVAVRSYDLVTDRYYVVAGQISTFGAGASWWYPESAARFIEQEDLPGQIYNPYSLGGYLTWRLGPGRLDYVDGRYVPFGDEFVLRAQALASAPPEDEEFRKEVDRYGINLVVVSVARISGLGGFPLSDYCSSPLWKLVYLDDTAAIFLRNADTNAPWLSRLVLDCSRGPLPEHPARTRVGRFQQDSNIAAIDFVLGRDAESAAAIERAAQVFPEDPHLFVLRGQLLQAHGDLRGAEQQYRTAIRLRRTESNVMALASLYIQEQRWTEAAEQVHIAASLSYHPQSLYLVLGKIELRRGDVPAALRAFHRALEHAPDDPQRRRSFDAQVWHDIALAWRQAGDMKNAEEAEARAAQSAKP